MLGRGRGSSGASGNLLAMRLIGLVGGTTWVSTAEYYAHLNRLANERLGWVEGAKLILWSMNFGDIQRNNLSENQPENMRYVLEGCRKVEEAGAAGVVICANTLHMFAAEIQPQIGIPIIHIVDAVASAIKAQGLTRVSLLGTRYTMELPFFREMLAAQGIEMIIPGETDREFINDTIYNEFPLNVFKPSTRDAYLRIIDEQVREGAQGIIQGCTEIPILLSGCELNVPQFDTLRLHAEAAADFMLS